MNNTLLPYVEVNPTQTPIASVIWLHGLGANGHDFADVLPQLQLPRELAIRFIFPHAPERPITLNGGYRMPAWYDILGLTENTPQDETGIKEATLEINKLIQHEQKSGLPTERIFLAGFSQGGALALHTSLHCPHRLAGVIALSAYLPLSDQIHAESVKQHKETPYLLAHGELDDLVPIAWGKQAAKHLTKLEYNVEWRSYPITHSVCLKELNDISSWLQKNLKCSKGEN